MMKLCNIKQIVVRFGFGAADFGSTTLVSVVFICNMAGNY